MWPIKSLAEEEVVTRDFLLGVTQQRRERFIAFFDDDKREVLAQLVEDEVAEAAKDQPPPLEELTIEGADAPAASQAAKAKGKIKFPLKLFTPYKLIRSFLSRKEFVIEDNINLANIWWLYDRFTCVPHSFSLFLLTIARWLTHARTRTHFSHAHQ
jgi:hypothetical protein